MDSFHRESDGMKKCEGRRGWKRSKERMECVMVRGAARRGSSVFVVAVV
jgi:hypothetical protein